jgi:nucleoid-associated protein YgaU
VAKAFLMCKMPPATVEFDFNPETITLQRASNTRQTGVASTKGSSSGSTGSIFQGSPQPNLDLGNVVIYGDETKSRCEQLLDWLNPGGGALAKAISAVSSFISGGLINLAAGQPQLIFFWGTSFTFECILSKCNVKYERFDASGKPIRAQLGLTLQAQPSFIGSLLTNPTSGGLPGRYVHIMSAGENLQTVSTAAYGTPACWRAIADVNGIDDPLGVTPGTKLYLPNEEELAGRW